MNPDEARIEAEVQKRLASVVAEQHQQFTAAMEASLKNALGGLEQTKVELECEQKKLSEDLESVHELRRKAELDGEKIALESFEKHRLQYEEAIRTSLLRDLTRSHIEGGKSTAEIMQWLDVEREFVEQIRSVVERVQKIHARKFKSSQLQGNPRVHFKEEGRSGVIYFESSVGNFDMWWEFGTVALVIVDVPAVQEWVDRTGIPLDERLSVLNFIGEEIVRRKTNNGSFVIGEKVLTIYST